MLASISSSFRFLKRSFSRDDSADSCDSSLDSGLEPSSAIQGVLEKNKETSALLEKRIRFLEKKLLYLESEARTCVSNGDRRGAIVSLRRRQLCSQEREKIEHARLSLEAQIAAIEMAHTQNIALQALERGIKAQKDAQKLLSFPKIDRLVDELQEQHDIQAEISQALQHGVPYVDEDALLGELHQLETAEIERRILQATVPPLLSPGNRMARSKTLVKSQMSRLPQSSNCNFIVRDGHMQSNSGQSKEPIILLHNREGRKAENLDKNRIASRSDGRSPQFQTRLITARNITSPIETGGNSNVQEKLSMNLQNDEWQLHQCQEENMQQLRWNNQRQPKFRTQKQSDEEQLEALMTKLE